jgi:hypothetical protein
MYREIVTDEMAELYRAFEDAVLRSEQGERLRLALFKEGDCYTLSVSDINRADSPQTDEPLLEQGCM